MVRRAGTLTARRRRRVAVEQGAGAHAAAGDAVVELAPVAQGHGKLNRALRDATVATIIIDSGLRYMSSELWRD